MEHSNCEFAEMFVRAHRWLHMTGEALDDGDEDQKEKVLERAHELHHKIIDLLNEGSDSSGVKLLAVYNALVAGIESMEKQAIQESLRKAAN